MERKGNGGYAHIRVVLQTGTALSPDLSTKEVGITKGILKPTDIKRLVRIILTSPWL
jgi:hypothetical protein